MLNSFASKADSIFPWRSIRAIYIHLSMPIYVRTLLSLAEARGRANRFCCCCNKYKLVGVTWGKQPHTIWLLVLRMTQIFLQSSKQICSYSTREHPLCYESHTRHFCIRLFFAVRRLNKSSYNRQSQTSTAVEHHKLRVPNGSAHCPMKEDTTFHECA